MRLPVAPEPAAELDDAIALARVSRLFGAVAALAQVDLRVARGETVVVRGGNGAGKTTLLRVVATSLSPTYGAGRVLGFDLQTEREEIRRRSELVSHRTRLYEDLTALENLRVWCSLAAADPARIAPALERLGLAGVARERVRGFSQGMRQRVALARLLVRDPELLLLDEPSMGLDAGGRAIVDEIVAGARAAGRTVVLATHLPVPAALAHRTVHLEDGRIIAGVP